MVDEITAYLTTAHTLFSMQNAPLPLACHPCRVYQDGA